MKALGKNFTTKGIDNIIAKFPEIKVQTNIDDKPRKVKQFHYCQSMPKCRKNPQLAGISKNAFKLIGYEPEDIEEDQNSPLYLSGSKLISGSMPIAHNYCGIQFGVWAGQLGDGRAHTLGTVKNQRKIYQLQLKGSGLSPFSRHADGNSVVSSAVRQFLASQLMHGLNIPTTRAASLVIGQQDVYRDPFYNRQIKKQNAAIVMRIAPSFLRIGSFQVCNNNAQMDTGNMLMNRKVLQPLIQYLHQNFYSHIDQNQCDIYETIFQQVVDKNAQLVAHWQTKGFVHGVMNTDNISMLGLTIDYGPFGFMDYYSKDYVSNQTDQYQRYSYRQQPKVMKWNLMQLADSFDVFIPKQTLYKYIQQNFDKIFDKTYFELMNKKLGLKSTVKSKEIIENLFEVMHICGSNFTNTFRLINTISNPTQIPQFIPKLLLQSLPTPYYLKNLRAFPNMKQITQQAIDNIKKHDDSFNLSFLIQQNKRIQLKNILQSETCEQRTHRQTKLWNDWLQQYLSQQIDCEIRDKNTIQYCLLNETAKNITQELQKLKASEQRNLLNRVLTVFQNPFKKDQWFEQKFWRNRPIPVRLTCSS